MISRIKSIFKRGEYKRIFENMISLTGLQFASYILPLITLPYLAFVLGPDRFGLTQYAISVVTYFQFLTDYGFNLSATREISINKESKHVNHIFSNVMLIKLILCVISFIILTILVFGINRFTQDWFIYYLSFGLVIGYMLFPTWFFQGMEDMKYITIINILGKVIFTVLIFLFVKTSGDYLLVPLFNSLGFIIVGIIGIITAIVKFNIKLVRPTLTELKYHLIEGWHVFISTIAINLYTTTNTFLLGLLTNNTLVGYYSIAEKIILAVNGLITPISQALYPFVSRLTVNDKENSLIFIRKIVKIISVIGFIFSLGIFLFAEPIINLLFGTAYADSIRILKILSFIPLIVSLSTVFGVQIMLTFNYKKAFSSILIIAGVINVIMGTLLILSIQELGIAISFFLTELFVTVAMFLFLQRKGIKIIEK
ncbi:MAG: flippase [Methanobacteriaceae archaeon]|nr:flippase [Methanobacteriaceae archaeon]